MGFRKLPERLRKRPEAFRRTLLTFRALPEGFSRSAVLRRMVEYRFNFAGAQSWIHPAQ
jgi:hypothetical protein